MRTGLTEQAERRIRSVLGAETVGDLLDAAVADFREIGILPCPARKLFLRLARERGHLHSSGRGVQWVVVFPRTEFHPPGLALARAGRHRCCCTAPYSRCGDARYKAGAAVVVMHGARLFSASCNSFRLSALVLSG